MTPYRGWMCYTWYLPCCEFPKVTTNWITVCKDSVHRCPPLVTRTIDCANWIMEPIAATYRRYLISSGAPLLIQSHPSVQCSMILLVFTNVFVAVIDFFFFSCCIPWREFALRPTRVSFSLCIVWTGGALLHLSCCRRALIFGGACSHVERLRSQNAVPASPCRAAGLMTNTWTLHMEGWLQVNTPNMVNEI